MANKEINDFTAKTTLVGTEEFLIQNAGGGATQKVTYDDMHNSKVGFANYSDLATGTTAITHNGVQGWLKLTNDAADVATNTSFLPSSVTSLWNTTTNQVDFTEMSIGSMFEIRADIIVTTSAVSQSVSVQLSMAIGSGIDFVINSSTSLYKAPGTYNLSIPFSGFLASTNTTNFPAEIQFDSTDSADIEVIGWFIKVIGR